MTEHERFSRAFLTAVGGMDCTDSGSAPPEGTPGDGFLFPPGSPSPKPCARAAARRCWRP